MATLTIQRLRPGMYRLSTEHESIILSAQDILDTMDYGMLWSSRLAREAQQQDLGRILPPDPTTMPLDHPGLPDVEE